MDKKFKPDHGKKTIFEAFGLTEEKYEELITKAIDAFNAGKVSQSSSLESAVKSVRGEFLGDDESVSQYELVLANTAFEMGKKQAKSQMHTMIEGILGNPLAKAMPTTITLGLLIRGIENVLNDGQDAHECNQTGGPGFEEKK